MRRLIFILFLICLSINTITITNAQYSISWDIVSSKIIDSKTFYVEYQYEWKTIYNINWTEYSWDNTKNFFFSKDWWSFDRQDTQKWIYSTVINWIEYFRDRQDVIFSKNRTHFWYIYQWFLYIDWKKTNIDTKEWYNSLVIDNLWNYIIKKWSTSWTTVIQTSSKSYSVYNNDFFLSTNNGDSISYLFKTVEGDTIFNWDSKWKLGNLLSWYISDDWKNVITTHQDNLENQKVYVNFKLVDSYSNIQWMIIDNLWNYKVIYVSRESNKLVYKYKDNTQDVVLKQVDIFSYSKCIQKWMIYNLINWSLYLDNKQVKDSVTFLWDSTEGCYYTNSKWDYTLISEKYGEVNNLSYNWQYFYNQALGRLYSNWLEYNVWQNLNNIVLNWDKFYIQSNDKININWTVYNLQTTSKITVSEDWLLAWYLEWKTYIIKSLSSIIKVWDSKSITWLSIEQTKDDTVTWESWENPNFEVISRENKLNKASLDKIINTNQLIVNKIEINWYQWYPYTETQPSYEEMNENNSYIINYKLPKWYNLLSIDAGKDFIVKLDKGNSRYYITPTTERVLREIYLDNSEDYTITYYYQQGVNKAKKIEIKGNIKYVYWFNFERDSFSFSNSYNNFQEKYLPSLWLIKYIRPEVKFLKKDRELSIWELEKIVDSNELATIFIIDWEILESAKTYKNSFFVKFLELRKRENFPGYCYWFVNSWLYLINKVDNLTSYWWTFINSLNVDSQNKNTNSSLGFKISVEWWKQLYLKNRVKSIYSMTVTSNLTNIWVQSSRGWWHSILWYKTEKYVKLDKYRVDSKNNIFFDYNNDWKYTEQECLSLNKLLCIKDDLNKLKFLQRTYVYDNSNKDDKTASVFIFQKESDDTYFWKLTSFSDYTWTMDKIFTLFF